MEIQLNESSEDARRRSHVSRPVLSSELPQSVRLTLGRYSLRKKLGNQNKSSLQQKLNTWDPLRVNGRSRILEEPKSSQDESVADESRGCEEQNRMNRITRTIHNTFWMLSVFIKLFVPKFTAYYC